MKCPTCGVDSRRPNRPMTFKAHTTVTDDALVNFVRFSCRCGWSMDVNTDNLRTDGDVKRTIAQILRRVGQDEDS